MKFLSISALAFSALTAAQIRVPSNLMSDIKANYDEYQIGFNELINIMQSVDPEAYSQFTSALGTDKIYSKFDAASVSDYFNKIPADFDAEAALDFAQNAAAAPGASPTAADSAKPTTPASNSAKTTTSASNSAKTSASADADSDPESESESESKSSSSPSSSSSSSSSSKPSASATSSATNFAKVSVAGIAIAGLLVSLI
ncbi:hypothetical protein AYI70_g1795 [Smittium culicis]|uniref:Uncharacterized protein n=1 Tax=Smittium culicis TaxID=133412 RepID=A0A1R1XAD9_9FUNG|nr:hypothetical protein AYI70_g9617 [Smittium culicis]OMJ24127.1 hypothetical protein AYI70_g1795 [Smittium culicis]